MEALNTFTTEHLEEHCCDYKHKFIIKTNNNIIYKYSKICLYEKYFSNNLWFLFMHIINAE